MLEMDLTSFDKKSVNHKLSISIAIYGKYDSGFGNYFSVHRLQAFCTECETGFRLSGMVLVSFQTCAKQQPCDCL